MPASTTPSPPAAPSLAPAVVAELRRALGSTLVHTHDPRYAALAGDGRWAAVVAAAERETVARAVLLADVHGLDLRLRGSGSGASTTHDQPVLLLDVSGMRGVAVDVPGRTAAVGAGTTWRELLGAVSRHGLVCAPAVDLDSDVVGSIVAGHVGPVGRALGGCVDAVRRLDVVAGDGSTREVGPLSSPDQFWALRGGGRRSLAAARTVVVGVVLDLLPDPGAREVVVELDPSLAGAVPLWWEWSLRLRDDVDTSLLRPSAGGSDTVVVLFTGSGGEVPLLRPDGSAPPVTRSGSLAGVLLGSRNGAQPHRTLVAAGTVPLPVPPSVGAARLRRLGGAAGRSPRVPDAVASRAATHALDLPLGAADSSGRGSSASGWSDPDEGPRQAVVDRLRRVARHVASRA